MESRSDLRRQYKETPMQAGIFLVTNTATGSVFLGSTTNLHGPLNKHRFTLSTGRHPNLKLQQDWNRFGAAAFKFEIVEVVQTKDDPAFDVNTELSLLEEIWIEKVQPFGERGYNLHKSIRE